MADNDGTIAIPIVTLLTDMRQELRDGLGDLSKSMVAIHTSLAMKADKTDVARLQEKVESLEDARSKEDTQIEVRRMDLDRREKTRRWRIGLFAGAAWAVPWIYVIDKVLSGH